MTTKELSAWLAAYGEAWRRRDPQAIVAIFAADATYRDTPYAEPATGRDGIRAYWAAAVEQHCDVQFDHRVLSVSEREGIAHWSATFRRAADSDITQIDGVFVLQFDSDGLCTELREWWHTLEPQANQ